MSLKSAVMFLGLLGLASCASQTVNKNLEAKLQNEKTPSGPDELGKNAVTTIKNLRTATDQQKTALLKVEEEMSGKSRLLRNESLKLRAILIKDIGQNAYDASEVDLIKGRLKDLEDRRLAIIFDVVDKTNKILGRQSSEKDEVLHSIDFDGIPRL